MTYERFYQLWDALVTKRPKGTDAAPIANGMTKATADALIEYGKGDRTKINKIEEFILSKQAT
jgi:hypothetical protein